MPSQKILQFSATDYCKKRIFYFYLQSTNPYQEWFLV